MCWGLFYFVLLVVEKLTGFQKRLGFFSHVYALIAIICGWTIFRAENLGKAGEYLSAMFGQTSAGFTDEIFWMYLSGSASVMALGCLLSMPVWPLVQRSFANTSFFPYFEPIWATGIFLLATLICISASYNPFIYFNF